jgi:hypothetical protein
VAGAWSGLANVGDSTGYQSQTAYVLPVQGTRTTSSTTMSMGCHAKVSIDTDTGVVTGG